MALKPDRDILAFDISKFWHTSGGAATRGGIAAATGTAPSGAAMDQSVGTVWYNPGHATVALSGVRPIGLLLDDIVNIDLTRQLLNPNKAERQVGDKVTLMTKGWVVTNSFDLTAGTIGVGAPAYMGPSGAITAHPGTVYPQLASGTILMDVVSQHPRVGKFLTVRDEDGYAKVQIDL